MWGQVPTYAKQVASEKIIPTRVGTSNTQGLLSASKQDHPHACGDKCTTFSERLTLSGSSPRVWGQGNRSGHIYGKRRIIPTRVGTSTKSFAGEMLPWDHPHACGDKHIPSWEIYTATGSSPRVWGQDCLNSFDNFFHMIIPTRVGTRKVEDKTMAKT